MGLHDKAVIVGPELTANMMILAKAKTGRDLFQIGSRNGQFYFVVIFFIGKRNVFAVRRNHHALILGMGSKDFYRHTETGEIFVIEKRGDAIVGSCPALS